MSHVRTNILPLLLFGLISLSACSSKDDSQAQKLLEEAQTAVENHQFQTAVTLIDSLRSAYPRAIEARRNSLHTLAVAKEGLALDALQRADSTVAVLSVSADSLQRLMKKVDNPIEPYFVASSTDPSAVRNATGIQARMSPEGDFYIIATLKGVSAKSTSVSVSNQSGESASTATVGFDGERNDRSNGMETITFMGSESEEFGKFIADHRGESLTLTFNGGRSHSILLPKTQADAVATVYDAASTLRALKMASVEKEKSTRALDLARSQAARTFVEEK